MRYFAIISYNGANYCGWQIQQNSQTVEQMVEYALSTILGEKIDVVGAGRTDSGVNAIEYIAHFDASDDANFLSLRRLFYIGFELVTNSGYRSIYVFKKSILTIIIYWI